MTRTQFGALALSIVMCSGPAFAKAHHRHHDQMSSHQMSSHKAMPQSGTATPPSGTVNAPASSGAGTGENKPTATGGQPGGGADHN